MIKMAQNFVGSNNLPLLHPMGQFGTRLQGGNDAASPRYIYTRLSSYSRLIYREEDDAVLDLKKEDGSDVEPLMFVPIIPTILVNGAHGIGTGWSTSIPQYCPLEVIDTVAAAVKGTPCDALPRLDPWYAGFEGKIDMLKSSSKGVDVEYVSHGRIAIPKLGGRSVRVTELPIGMWTGDFKDLLDKLCQEGTVDGGALVQNYTESSTESKVDFEVMLTKSGFDQLSSRQGKKPVLQEQLLIKVLKLKSKLLLSNMMAIGTDGVIKRYTDPRQIIADFMVVRRLTYAKRKEYQLAQLGIKVLKAKNRAKFVEMVAGGGLTLAELSKTKLEGELERMGFERFERAASGVNDYDYLTSMPILSCTSDKLAALQAEAVRLDGQLALLKGMTIEDIWLSELAELKAEVVKYYKERGIALKSR
jgi:DNA topoisomerase-2